MHKQLKTLSITVVLFFISSGALYAQSKYRVNISNSDKEYPLVAIYTIPADFEKGSNSNSETCWNHENPHNRICIETKSKSYFSGVEEILGAYSSASDIIVNEKTFTSDKHKVSYQEIESGEGVWTIMKHIYVTNVFDADYYTVIAIEYSSINDEMSKKLQTFMDSIQFVQLPKSEAPTQKN